MYTTINSAKIGRMIWTVDMVQSARNRSLRTTEPEQLTVKYCKNYWMNASVQPGQPAELTLIHGIIMDWLYTALDFH